MILLIISVCIFTSLVTITLANIIRPLTGGWLWLTGYLYEPGYTHEYQLGFPIPEVALYVSILNFQWSGSYTAIRIELWLNYYQLVESEIWWGGENGGYIYFRYFEPFPGASYVKVIYHTYYGPNNTNFPEIFYTGYCEYGE